MAQNSRQVSSRLGSNLLPFYVWLGLFYACWLLLIYFGNYWSTVREHWPIALAMSFGSFIAGSTPMGGGTVGFPVLVLFFGFPGALGRNFGLAIQSIGMVSAAIYILSTGKPLEWKLLRWAMLGAIVGMPLGAIAVAPIMADLWVKILFATIWASFGVMHLMKMRELVAAVGISHSWQKLDVPIGTAIGIVGGVVASLTGVGIDMIVYAVLVLLYRSDLKIAIPTSVLLMAFTSVLGIATNWVLSQINPEVYPMQPEVFQNWLAAAPVVALGAPLGSFIVSLISRTPTLILVSLLCILQFVWTMFEEQVSLVTLVAALVGVVAMNVVFQILYRYGHRKRRSANLDISFNGKPKA